MGQAKHLEAHLTCAVCDKADSQKNKWILLDNLQDYHIKYK